MIAAWLVRLYPATWRERYAAEFSDLLRQRPPSRRDQLDIVRGAFDARLHPALAGEAPRRHATGTDRLLALGGVTAGALMTVWALIIAVAQPRWGSGSQVDDDLMAASYGAGFLGTLIAMAVLVGIAARHAEELGTLGTVGALLTTISFLLMLGQAGVLAMLLLPLATLVFGSGLVRIIPWPIVVVMVGSAAAMTAAMFGLVASEGQLTLWLSLGLACGPSWVLLGIFLRRGPRARTVALVGA